MTSKYGGDAVYSDSGIDVTSEVDDGTELSQEDCWVVIKGIL